MLAAELPFAITPSAGRDHAGETAVDAGGIDGDGRAEAVPEHADAIGIDLLAGLQEGQRVLRIRHLVEAAHLGPLALALAAAAEVEAQRHIAHLLQHARLDLGVGLVLRADEPVQDDEAGKLLAGLATVRHVEDGRELQAIRHKRQTFFHGAILGQCFSL